MKSNFSSRAIKNFSILCSVTCNSDAFLDRLKKDEKKGLIETTTRKGIHKLGVLFFDLVYMHIKYLLSAPYDHIARCYEDFLEQ